MTTIHYKALFWIWLNRTSVATVTGMPMAGGQRHIAFGRSRRDIEDFFRGSAVESTDNSWSFSIEPFQDMPACRMTFVENLRGNRRALECRIPQQSPRSPAAHPVWKRAIIRIPETAEPRQVLLFFRDENDAFHLRVLDASEFYLLPSEVVRAILESRNNNEQHVLEISGNFREDEAEYRKPVVSLEEGFSGSVTGPEITKPQPEGSHEWEEFVRYIQQTEGRTRRSRVQSLTRLLRRPDVRSIALRCFGHRCQVRGCEFTKDASPEIFSFLLEVHHLRSVASGGSDSLLNLAVLCANHHRLCERLPNVRVIEVEDVDDVIVTYDSGSFMIERDLSELRCRLAD